MPYFPLQVTIPEPCSENWDNMTPVDEQQRHCAACDKTLTDFSYMTDRQIGQILRVNEGNLCGRFRRSQLDRPLRLNGPRRRRGFGAIAASAGLLLAAPAFGQGVAPEPTEQVESKSEKQNTSAPGKVTIRGVVTDVSGEPLIGASILIKGTTSGAVADLEGRFELRLSTAEEVVLRIDYTGFTTEEITYSAAKLRSLAQNPENPLITYVLEDSGVFLGGVVVTCVVRKKNTLLDNLMVHSVQPIYEAPDYSYRTKPGDWKDYWRDLFAKRKAHRAERRAARQARKAAKQTTIIENTEITEVAVPKMVRQDLVRQPFNLLASPNPFNQELRVTCDLSCEESITLYLLDLSGRIILQEKYDLQPGKQDIVLGQKLGSLTPGTYLLRLVGEEGAQETIRVVR